MAELKSTTVNGDVSATGNVTGANITSMQNQINELNSNLSGLSSYIGKIHTTSFYDIEFNIFFLPITINDVTYDPVEITGFKMVAGNGRYIIIGSVLSGKHLPGSLMIYNSWQNAWKKL